MVQDASGRLIQVSSPGVQDLTVAWNTNDTVVSLTNNSMGFWGQVLPLALWRRSRQIDARHGAWSSSLVLGRLSRQPVTRSCQVEHMLFRPIPTARKFWEVSASAAAVPPSPSD
jgi:hypothetical protein